MSVGSAPVGTRDEPVDAAVAERPPEMPQSSPLVDARSLPAVVDRADDGRAPSNRARPAVLAPGSRSLSGGTMDPQLQRELIQPDGWIINGELGPTRRARSSPTGGGHLIVLDLALARCACRALRRSRERLDSWPWLWSYRSKSLPLVLTATATNAPTAERHVLPTPCGRRALHRPCRAGSCESRRKNDGTAGPPNRRALLHRCHRAGARANQPRHPFWNASNSIQTLEPITAFAIEQVSRGLVDRHLVFANLGHLSHALEP
jgi:hypothetical protein